MNNDGSNIIRVTNTSSNATAINPVWKPITNPTSVKKNGQSFNSLPKNFQLFQNYPNPFNPATKIKFNLPEKEFVTMKIYDVLGKEIATPLQNTYEAGVHEVLWSGAKHSSGMYFYQLSTNKFKETKKMILAK